VPDQRNPDRSLPQLAAELWELVRTYVEQETKAPLRGVANFLKFGLIGAFLLGVGLLLLSIALLRALQVETGDTFAGNWSFVPYLITLIACGAVVVFAGLGMRKRGSST
jgi:hypothetical protein